MARSRRIPYDPMDPRWWGINEDGTPDEKKLGEVIEAIVRTAHPEEIILFGSGAAGTMKRTERPRPAGRDGNNHAPENGTEAA